MLPDIIANFSFLKYIGLVAALEKKRESKRKEKDTIKVVLGKAFESHLVN